MAMMKWDEFMSVGIETIDDQHKQLIDLINQAYEAIQRHDSRIMTQILDQMSHYADKHFADEEELMKQHGFPELEHHKLLHRKFSHDVKDFRKNQFEKTNFSKLFVYLSRWLTTHIMDEDKKYMTCIPKDQTEQE